jgi:hypothetical protein
LGGEQKNAALSDGFSGVRSVEEKQENYFMYAKDRGEMPIERCKNL